MQAMGIDEVSQDAGILRPHDTLALRARDVPGAVALVVDGGASLTFRRWDEQSSAFARGPDRPRPAPRRPARPAGRQRPAR
jgi:hypothetical protein